MAPRAREIALAAAFLLACQGNDDDARSSDSNLEPGPGGPGPGFPGPSGGSAGAGEGGSAGAAGSTGGAAGSEPGSGPGGEGGEVGIGGAAGAGGVAGADGAAGTAGCGPSLMPTCGDCQRTSATEECDTAGATPLCSAACLRLEATVSAYAPIGGAGGAGGAGGTPNPASRAYYMGAGVHSVASGSLGHAVVTESRTSPGRVLVTMRTPNGDTLGSFETGSMHPPAFNADPVVAVTETGFVAAWTTAPVGGDGDEQGIALQRFDGASAVGPPVIANTSTAFTQRRPDILWTGTELVVAWEDESGLDTGPDLHIRTFTSDLKGSTEKVLAGTESSESRVSLTRHNASYVAAWRSVYDGVEYIRVQHGDGPVASLGPLWGADPEDAPAVASVGPDYVVVAYAARDYYGATRIRGAFVNVTNGTVYSDYLLVPTELGYDNESYPSLASVGGALYLSWTARESVVLGNGDDTLLSEVAWMGGVAELSGAIRRSPRTHTDGSDQRRIRVSSAEAIAGSEAVFVAWEDDTSPANLGAARPDVAFTLLPYPFFDSPPGEP